MRGLQLNQPLYAIPFIPAADVSAKSFMSVNWDNIILEAFKKSEDGQGYILILSEKKGRSVFVEVSLAQTYSMVYECNMIEREEVQFAQNVNILTTTMKPFEVKTFKLVM